MESAEQLKHLITEHAKLRRESKDKAKKARQSFHKARQVYTESSSHPNQ